MSAAEPRVELFRPEALAAHRAGSGPVTPLSSSHRLTSGAFWALLVVVVVAIVGAFSLQVEETSSGVWRAGPRPGVATIVLPIGALARLQTGVRVGLHTAGTSRVIDASVLAVLNPQPIGAVLTSWTRLPRPLVAAGAVTVVEVRLPPGVRGQGRATAHLGRRSVAAELVPGLRREARRGG